MKRNVVPLPTKERRIGDRGNFTAWGGVRLAAFGEMNSAGVVASRRQSPQLFGETERPPRGEKAVEFEGTGIDIREKKGIGRG